MCLINCNIVEGENKGVKRNSDITYEERVKKQKYVKKEIYATRNVRRNKLIISRKINRHNDEKMGL